MRRTRPARLLLAVLASALVLHVLPSASAAEPRKKVETWPTPGSVAITLTGHGFGHGKGLSQYGASAPPTQGLTWQQIDEFYYPDTTWGTDRRQDPRPDHGRHRQGRAGGRSARPQGGQPVEAADVAAPADRGEEAAPRRRRPRHHRAVHQGRQVADSGKEGPRRGRALDRRRPAHPRHAGRPARTTAAPSGRWPRARARGARPSTCSAWRPTSGASSRWRSPLSWESDAVSAQSVAARTTRRTSRGTAAAH